MHAEATNSTTIRFTWNAPSPQFINGINQGYKVREVSPGPGGSLQGHGPETSGAGEGGYRRASPLFLKSLVQAKQGTCT